MIQFKADTKVAMMNVRNHAGPQAATKKKKKKKKKKPANLSVYASGSIAAQDYLDEELAKTPKTVAPVEPIPTGPAKMSLLSMARTSKLLRKKKDAAIKRLDSGRTIVYTASMLETMTTEKMVRSCRM